MVRLNNKMKKRFAVAGTLALGMFSLMFLTGSAENDADENSLVQIEQNESELSNIQLVQFGQVDKPNVDLTVNPFVETASSNGSQDNAGENTGGNYRNLPAIPAVYPTSQPRPMLPLPSIPRSAPQQQAVAASAPAPANASEAAPKENKEAKIAFLGGGEIMFAQGMENGK